MCRAIAWYLRNTYMVAPQLTVAEGNEIRSKEGTIQDNHIAMAIDALAISVLQQKITISLHHLNK